MAILHYQNCVKDAVGTTAASVEEIGTVTIPSNATHLHGFITQMVATGTQTSAEAVSGKFKFELGALGRKPLWCTANRGYGGAPATKN